MWRKDIEIILARQLASYLHMPIFIVDPAGNLLYYNEPAEQILGQRFAETGMMTADEWSQGFVPTSREGDPIPADDLPLMVALAQHKPSHSEMWIHPFGNEPQLIDIWAFPLKGIAGTFLGAMAIFWRGEE